MEPEPTFLADSMLGKLARWLRALGFDAAYERAMEDGDLVERARAEGRILLTRDRRLLHRRRLVRGLLVEADEPAAQLRQLRHDLGLRFDPDRWFRRCLDCNLPMRSASADEVRNRVPPYVLATQQVFASCPGCGKVYWAATHVEGMRRRLEEAIGAE